MLAYTYTAPGKFELREKPKPVLLDERDAIVRVTLASICTSDLHIKHGSVPRAVPGITVGHEMVGIVEQVGPKVTTVRRVTGSPSTLKPSAENVSSASTDGSTTAPTRTAVGHSAAGLTAARRNMSGSLMLTRDWTGFPTE